MTTVAGVALAGVENRVGLLFGEGLLLDLCFGILFQRWECDGVL